MTTFNDLPLELLPGIVQHVVLSKSLASFCRVNKTFCKFTQPFLYHTIVIFPWHNKKKIASLFRTLSSSPQLAKHVHTLEIRNFPKGLDDVYRDILMDSCLRGLTNTVNLRSCTWTRAGTLTPDILLAIVKNPHLQELAINGGCYESYDPTILPRFTSVRRINLILPSPPVIGVLPMWLNSLVNPLQSLTVVCRDHSAVTDELLEQISENLSGLDELSLTGCTRVTHEGLAKALYKNKNGIKSLGIGGVSTSLNLAEFDRQCQSARLLNRLTSLTISIDSISAWTKGIPSLVSSPLEYLQLYGTKTIKGEEADDLVTAFISTHGPLLKRFALGRVPISLRALDEACTGFTNLEQLFTTVAQKDLWFIGNALSKASKLQAAHINLGRARAYIYQEEALQIVKQCSPTLTEIGCATCVWQVVREVIQLGEDRTTITNFAPCDTPQVPDIFRVVHG